MDVVPMMASEHFYALPGDAEWNLLAIWRYLKITYTGDKFHMQPNFERYEL